MAIKYDLTVFEILKLLGCAESKETTKQEEPEIENQIKLPAILTDFLSIAHNNPLFSTSDIWTDMASDYYFFYEEIEEMIEEDREYWEENPEEYADNEYFQFSKMPKEQWSSRVADYLLIGSDYGAGVVTFGICKNDLEQENPPVYTLHEADSLTEWKPCTHTLSDFFMHIVGSILSCEDYNTAIRVLDKKGWEISETENPKDMKEVLSQKNIDMSAIKKYPAMRYSNYTYCSFVYDDESMALYLIRKDFSDKLYLTIIEKVSESED